jgi:hypothetical protein
MTETLKVTLEKRDGLAVIYTEGYINNQGGEEIAKIPAAEPPGDQDRQLHRDFNTDRDHRENARDRGSLVVLLFDTDDRKDVSHHGSHPIRWDLSR